MNNLFEIKKQIRKLISEELTKKTRDSFVNKVLILAKQIGVTNNSNLIILRDSLLALIVKLSIDKPYGKSERDKLLRVINQTFIKDGSNTTEGLKPKWENEQEMIQYINSEFSGNPVGSIIQDYSGYKYKVWKWNKGALYMVCESLDDNKVYWVDTEELLKGFVKV